jgi:hypothetical protein
VVPLSSTALISTLIAIVVVGALLSGLLTAMRRRRLRRRFGPEYDRLVTKHGSKRAAEAELAQRERRARALDIRPLTGIARQRYAKQWAAIQERFVDAPAEAVAASRALVTAVMAERGYPTDDQDQVLADLSVDHQAAVEHFRAADEISGNPAPGAAVTEDLRLALIHYRELFRDLLGDQADQVDPAAGGEVGPSHLPPSETADRAGADRRANGSVDQMPRS